MFTEAIKAVYPDITIIGSTPTVDPIPDHISLDYHEYSRPDNFVREFGLFDHYNRSHPILIGKIRHELRSDTTNSEQVNTPSSSLTTPAWLLLTGHRARPDWLSRPGLAVLLKQSSLSVLNVTLISSSEPHT